MTDTNHHVLTGKVDITSNLLVGSSHLFVDTNNNRVGLITTNPDAGLHVNSNAYVNTDLRVGSQIEINATAGRVKAGSFEGDGSLLQNTPPGADGAAATIAVGTTTTGLAGTDASVTNSGTSSAAVFDFVIPRGDAGTNGTNGTNGNDGANGEDGAAATIAVGTTTPGPVGTTTASVTNSGTSSAAVFDFVIPRGEQGTPGTNGTHGTNYFTLSGSNIYRTTGNVGIGTTSPDYPLDVQYNSDSGIRSKGTGSNHASVYIDAGSGNGYLRFQHSGTDKFWIQSTPTGDLAFRPNGSSHVFDINNSGYTRVSAGDSVSYVQTDHGGSIWRNYGTTLGAGLHFTDNAVIPADHNGTNHHTNVVDLGASSYKWRNLYVHNYAHVGSQIYTYELDLRRQRHVSGYGTYLEWPNNGHHIDCYRHGHGAHDFHINYYAQRTVYLNRSGYSDRRIKEDIKDIDDVSALNILRKIKPKTYKYKLQPNKGTVYGFIAQDVREVLPYATNLTKLSAPFNREDFVDANILEDGTVELISPCEQIEVGKNAHFYYETSISTRDFTVLEILSPTRFKVEVDSIDKEWIGQAKLVGKEVDDFHGIDKDAIFTVATAALQEVDRQLQTTKEELQTEKKKTATMELLVASLLKRVGDLENLVI